MNPMHSTSVQTSADQHLEAQRQQQHQQQRYVQQDPQQHLQDLQRQQQQQPDMTVLESLEPAQPVMSSLDTVQQQHQMMIGNSHGSNLHQLQTPAANSELNSMQIASTNDDGHQQHQQQAQEQPHDEQQQQPRSASNQKQAPFRLRTQIDGIVEDAGARIVQWLMENFETAEGESLARSTVYNYYLAHCRKFGMPTVNAASFGKLIRSVFLGLRTRRLGMRGHSKYHYFGVRAKPHVSAELQQMIGSGASSTRDAGNDQSDNGGSDTDSTGGAGSGRCSGNTIGRKRAKLRSSPHDSADLMILGSANEMHARPDELTGAHRDHHPHQAADGQHHMDCTDHNGHELHQMHPHRHSHLSAFQQQHHGCYQQHHVNGAGAYAAGSDGYGRHQQGLADNGTMINGTISSASSMATNASHCINVNMMNAARIPNQLNDIFPVLDESNSAEWKQYLGANWATLVEEHWPKREAGVLEGQLMKSAETGRNDNIDRVLIGSLQGFESKYRAYYQRMIELLSELKFSEIGPLWCEFWHPNQAPQQHQQQHPEPNRWTLLTGSAAARNNTNSSDDNQSSSAQQQHTIDSHMPQSTVDYQKHEQQQLTFSHLYHLTSHPLVIERINSIDYNLYAAIESFLLPDILSPIPRALAHQIRTFAKRIAHETEMSVQDYSPQFYAEKSKSARSFGYTLRRYTSLNHLATASRAIWEKRDSLTQMSCDLSMIDLRDIEHQVSLMGQVNVNSVEWDFTPNVSSMPHCNEAAFDRNAGPASAPQGAPSADIGLNREHASINNNGSQTNITSNKNDNTGSSIVDENGLKVTNNNVDTAHDNSNVQKSQSSSQSRAQQQNHSEHNGHNSSPKHQSNQERMLTTHQLCTMQPTQLIQNFLHLLENLNPANSWPDWCRNLVESRVDGHSVEQARNFVYKWNFYISLIMKELTLRSAPSLGLFQLVRLLFDEYIYYLVVSRLTQAHSHNNNDNDNTINVNLQGLSSVPSQSSIGLTNSNYQDSTNDLMRLSSLSQ